MEDHAFVMKLGSLLMTDNDQDIVYDGTTYLADGSLFDVKDVTDTFSSIPRVEFSVICRPGSDQYNLLNDDPGPIEGAIFFVELVSAAWESRWEFRGILSSGSMRDYLYEGSIEHIISWKLRTRKPLLWDNSTQQGRHAGDLGLEFIHEIEDIQQAIDWKGINA